MEVRLLAPAKAAKQEYRKQQLPQIRPRSERKPPAEVGGPSGFLENRAKAPEGSSGTSTPEAASTASGIGEMSLMPGWPPQVGARQRARTAP